MENLYSLELERFGNHIAQLFLEQAWELTATPSPHISLSFSISGVNNSGLAYSGLVGELDKIMLMLRLGNIFLVLLLLLE